MRPAYKRLFAFFAIPFGICLLGALLFFGGRFLYGLGQTLSSDATFLINGTPTHSPAPTVTPTAPTVTRSPTPGPSATPTFYYIIPTATATLIPWTTCPGIVISVRDTEQGDYLHVLRCEDQYEYEIGPLTKGAYAVAPDDRYLVYASTNGLLYASKIGDPTLYTIVNLKKKGPFVAFPKKVVPDFKLKFIGDAPPFVLEVYEAQYGQNFPVQIPNWLSQ
ncbi:MAG: hypothetical protein IT310_07465 [Anaerolineales bacterium]|nr:hypothetical protein [Anaerolineales bacterium]